MGPQPPAAPLGRWSPGCSQETGLSCWMQGCTGCSASALSLWCTGCSAQVLGAPGAYWAFLSFTLIPLLSWTSSACAVSLSSAAAVLFGLLGPAIVCQAGRGLCSSSHSHRGMLLDFSVLLLGQFPGLSRVAAVLSSEHVELGNSLPESRGRNPPWAVTGTTSCPLPLCGHC